MKKHIILALIHFIFISVSSQNIIIKGYVNDFNTGETIIGVNIFDTISLTGTTTNKFGYFTLQVKSAETHTLRFSHVGYETKILTLKFDTDTILKIGLKLSPNNLNEVTVLSQKKLEDRPEISKMNIPVSTIVTLPSISGEPDILKAIQLLPGVHMGAENTNGLFVRGGSPDQNLFLLDDVTLYSVNHLGGFFSVFDPAMLKSVEIYKGGFPARFGGRISSVVDVRNKDGNLFEHHGEISAGLVSGKLFLEGPLKSSKSSYALSYRMSNFGLYSLLMNKLQGVNYTQGYNFYDLNFKTNFILSPRNRLFFSIYTGSDNIYYKEKDVSVERTNYIYSGKSDISWGNNAGSLRWLHIFENGLFNNVTLSLTDYRYINSVESIVKNKTNNTKQIDYYVSQSGIKDLSLKSDAEIPLTENIIRFGLSFVKHWFKTGSVTHSQSQSDTDKKTFRSDLGSCDIYSYFEYEFNMLKSINANVGFRSGMYVVNNKIFPVFEPRFVLNYKLLPSVSLKTSFCSMNQNIHLLSNSDGGFPTDIWIPATDKIKPENSDQFSIGIAHTSLNNYEFSMEIYTKKIRNLIDYKDGIIVSNYHQNWEKKLETGGVGKTNGIELLLQKKYGSFNGWAAYTLSSNKRKFANINNGKEFHHIYDQTHNISLTGNYTFNNSITLSAVWMYHSGNFITLPSAKYQLINYNFSDKEDFSVVEIYTEKNGYRLPAYHRLDLSINKSKQLKKGRRNWSINVFNLYNRQNAYYLFYKKSEDGSTKLYQRSFFPIIVNVGYSYKW